MTMTVNKLFGMRLDIRDGFDARSYCAGLVTGMAPFGYQGCRASHERLVREHPEAEARDVVVISDGDERSMTFDEFEAWIGYTG